MHSKGYHIPAADLCKFYSRPLDVKNKKNDEVGSDNDCDPGFFLLKERDTILKTPMLSNVGTQTDYRESESQTDPWDPPFYINRKYKLPEVLLLKELSYGNGLPASQTEIKYIIGSRKNKLPDSSTGNAEEFLKKKNIIKKQVKNEWDYKISKHSEKQLEKLKQMKTALAAELIKQSEKKEKLLKNIWIQKNNQMVQANLKLKNDLGKKINLLEEKLKLDAEVLEGKATKATTKTKELYYTEKHKNDLPEEMSYLLSKYYNNPNGLTRVTEWLERKKSEMYNEIPLARPVHKDQREKLAEKAYHDLLEKKQTKLPPKVYREEYDKENETAAPSVKGEIEFDVLELPEEGIDLITVFQQVLRGRAYQKQMLELIQKHKDAFDILPM